MDCKGLCHRCEHRVRWYETGGDWQPRVECAGTVSKSTGIPGSVCSCYMYKPVSPVVLEKAAGDDRPALGPAMIAARMHPVRVAECSYNAIITENTIVPYCIPKQEEGI